MTEGVGIGTAIVSYIEPYVGVERDFNRWYERDHFPAAVLAGPGVYAGARWVATRECKDLRFDGSLFGDPDEGSYLSMAWLLPDTQEDWDDWVGGQVEMLEREDRMFPDRDHLHTAIYEYRWEAREAEAPPSFLALNRGFPGLIAIAIESEDDGWARDLVDPELPLVVAFRRERLLLTALEDEPADHTLVLCFVEGDAIEVWDRLVGPVLETQPNIGFAGPFFATVPGTDLFVDEL